jgi:hypothetical protein
MDLTGALPAGGLCPQSVGVEHTVAALAAVDAGHDI